MNNDTSRKFFDVAHPGERAPSATSRPVISKPPAPDPFLHQSIPEADLPKVPPQTAVPAPIDEQPAVVDLDPTALLIQADAYHHPKASKSGSYKAFIILLCVLLLVMAGVSYFMVKSL